MDHEQQFDDEKQPEQPAENKKNAVGFWSLVCAVAFFLIGVLEVSFMEFFSVKFTVIFVSVMGSLSAVSFIVWFISNRKTR